jgi:predicted GTPase
MGELTRVVIVGAGRDFHYSPAQLEALAHSIDAVPADVVVSGTPIDLAALVRPGKPVVRARYEFAEVETPGLGGEIDRFLARYAK